MITLRNTAPCSTAGAGRFWRIAWVFLLIALLPTPASSQVQPLQQRIQAQTIEFIQTFLRRSLTASEREKVSQEEIGKNSDFSEDVLNGLTLITKTLRDDDGSPAAWRIRHNIIKNMLFDPARQKKLSVKLALAVDPVSVIDSQHQEFMTSQEVLSVVYIARFAKFGGEPAAINNGRNPKDATAASTLAELLSSGVASGGNLPEMFVNAGGFWNGLIREWGALSEEEKTLVRRYANDTLKGRMSSLPDAMYVRLMGWSKKEVELDRLNKTIDRSMHITMLQARMSMMRSLMFDSSPVWLVGPQ